MIKYRYYDYDYAAMSDEEAFVRHKLSEDGCTVLTQVKEHEMSPSPWYADPSVTVDDFNNLVGVSPWP